MDFSDTEIAFKSKTNAQLIKARWLFRTFNWPWLVRNGPAFATKALKLNLPVKWAVKSTIFEHFCGGEDIYECRKTIENLSKFKVKSILDYSVEGEKNENGFDYTCSEIQRTILEAKGNSNIPFSVFKTTGIAPFELLAKSDAGDAMSETEEAYLKMAKERFQRICLTAYENQVRLFVDAEESWIQKTIDCWTEEMMALYNKDTAIIYNTVQMYRHDRVDYIKSLYEKSKQENFFIGLKIVRGAYMEKERERALQMAYPSPIQPNKEASDKDYDDAVFYCLDKPTVFICAGTHNETSCRKLAGWMDERGITKNDPRFYFSQLLGMSDNLSFNLAAAGYNVAKYVPYGPIISVLPYLGRRAQENSSIKGQTGRELSLIEKELKRRNA